MKALANRCLSSQHTACAAMAGRHLTCKAAHCSEYLLTHRSHMRRLTNAYHLRDQDTTELGKGQDCLLALVWSASKGQFHQQTNSQPDRTRSANLLEGALSNEPSGAARNTLNSQNHTASPVGASTPPADQVRSAPAPHGQRMKQSRACTGGAPACACSAWRMAEPFTPAHCAA